MGISKPVGAVVAAAALAGLLAACSSAGGSTGPVAGGSKIATAPTPTATSTTAVPEVVPPTVSPGKVVTNAEHPAPVGRRLTGFGDSSSAPSQPSHGSPGVPSLSAPVTYESVSVPSLFNCREAGTTYYTPPNIAVGFDVTVLVNSSTLAKDLVIAAPNRAPRGVSNASELISSAQLGKGVWKATYRTFASLYEPRYTPVTVSSLEATAGGARYTIVFPSPVSITRDACHS